MFSPGHGTPSRLFALKTSIACRSLAAFLRISLSSLSASIIASSDSFQYVDNYLHYLLTFYLTASYTPVVTDDQKSLYRAALKEARSSFEKATKDRLKLSVELARLNDDIARLRRTITALSAMCSESPSIDNLGITDACMEVMDNTPFTVSTGDVVGDLDNLGFDLDSQKNVNASVHAVLTRLAAKGKITKVEDGDKVLWRGPNYDEKMDIGDLPF